jgi:hypothetical protein
MRPQAPLRAQSLSLSLMRFSGNASLHSQDDQLSFSFPVVRRKAYVHFSSALLHVLHAIPITISTTIKTVLRVEYKSFKHQSTPL